MEEIIGHRPGKLRKDPQDTDSPEVTSTLRRRLIAKTEEVEAKENLIRDKEKLFLELKNVLARQPGAEIHEQLIRYK